MIIDQSPKAESTKERIRQLEAQLSPERLAMLQEIRRIRAQNVGVTMNAGDVLRKLDNAEDVFPNLPARE